MDDDDGQRPITKANLVTMSRVKQVTNIYLSFTTGMIACDHYARECEFVILKKKTKIKTKKKQENSFGCVLTK